MTFGKPRSPETKQPFHPERELSNLREEKPVTPEGRRERQEALKEYVERLVEQRRFIGGLIRELRDRALSSIETAGGGTLKDAYETADRLFLGITPKPGERVQGTAPNSLPPGPDGQPRHIEEFIRPKEGATFDGVELEKNLDSRTFLNLDSESWLRARNVLRRAVEIRESIVELRKEAPDATGLFRLLFGREPKGEISVMEGAFSLHFRCRDLEDYSLIYSGCFAEEGRRDPTKEEKKDADKSGGVAISKSRAEILFSEPDRDLYLPDGSVDGEALESRRASLKRLAGVVTAENATRKATDQRAWEVFRHEETHVFNRLVSTERPWPGKARGLTSYGPARRAADRFVLLRERKDGTPEEQERYAASLQAVIAGIKRQTEERIEERGRDEILAYYSTDGLEKAVGKLRESLFEKIMRKLGRGTKPYLKRRQSEHGLYDYHDAEESEYTREQLVNDIWPIINHHEIPLSGEDDEKKNQEKLVDLVDDAIDGHRERYLRMLDRAHEAIALLEKNGFSQQDVRDVLAVEPLRNWYSMAKRLTKKT